MTTTELAKTEKGMYLGRSWAYDTIYLRALKSWQNGQLSLARGKETKKLRKN